MANKKIPVKVNEGGLLRSVVKRRNQMDNMMSQLFPVKRKKKKKNGLREYTQ